MFLHFCTFKTPNLIKKQHKYLENNIFLEKILVTNISYKYY
jgi:hypothetical protein